MKAETLVEALDDTLAMMEADTLGDKQGEVKAKAVLNALADWQAEFETE